MRKYSNFKKLKIKCDNYVDNHRGSPRAYYEQDGDVVVCQNCGNRFTMSMIEEQKGGCNPIPIMPENKTETDDEIVIDKEYLKQNKGLFTANWRTK